MHRPTRTLNSIASSGTELAPIARRVKHVLPLVLGDDVQGWLDEELSLVTHKILNALQEHPQTDKLVDDLRNSICSIRGAVALENDELPSIPYQEDILTMDMNDLSIPTHVVPLLYSHGLGPATLGETSTGEPKFPVHGILFGYNRRPFFTLTLERDGHAVQLPMFIDTGGQETTLNEASFKLLAPQVDFSNWSSYKEMNVVVHGTETGVKLGHGRTAGVNMVGCHWLEKARLALIVDYRGLGCVLLDAAAEPVPLVRTYR